MNCGCPRHAAARGEHLLPLPHRHPVGLPSSGLHHRREIDILIAIRDGLKGFPQAINAVFAETQIQTYIVHRIRNSLDFYSWKDRKPAAKELKSIYRAEDAEAAAAALREFEDADPGAGYSPPSPRSGAAIGRMSSHFLPAPRRCAK
jgi:hypothetical protein